MSLSLKGWFMMASVKEPCNSCTCVHIHLFLFMTIVKDLIFTRISQLHIANALEELKTNTHLH